MQSEEENMAQTLHIIYTQRERETERANTIYTNQGKYIIIIIIYSENMQKFIESIYATPLYRWFVIR